MTTSYIKITPQNPIPPRYAPDEVRPSPVQPKITFEPVSEAIIAEIMGYVSLGLSETVVSKDSMEKKVFIWHTWLKRMNEWMKENRKNYPRLMLLPEVKVPADLFFLAGVRGSEDAKLAHASTAPLGPLYPTDLNTLVHALKRGVSSCVEKDYDQKTYATVSLVDFVRHVNKISTFAIEPQYSGTTYFFAPQQDTTLGLTSRPDMSNGSLLPVSNNSIVPNRTENFTVKNGWKNGKMGNRSSKYFPNWVWVVALMGILYLLVKNSTAGSLNKVISISDFNVPRS